MWPFSFLVQSSSDPAHKMFDNVIDKNGGVVGKKIKVEANTLPELKRAIALRLAVEPIRTDDFYIMAWDRSPHIHPPYTPLIRRTPKVPATAPVAALLSHMSVDPV